MTLFGDSLETFRGLGALSGDLLNHVPREVKMRAAARKVAETFDLPERPSEEELLQALGRFQTWCSGGSSPKDHDWRLAPWICLLGEPRLLSHKRFEAEFGRRLASERRPMLLKALIYSYLREFEEDAREVTQAGRLIALELARHQSPWADRWRERQQTIRLFETQGLVERLASKSLTENGDVRGTLRALGFTTELIAHSGLHEPLAIQLLNSLSLELRSNPDFSGEVVQQAIGFMRAGSKLRFPSHRVELADRLLAPFAHKELNNLSARASLMKFFDEVYGDPRSQRQMWLEVSADAKKTITRWLVRKALDLFFDILSATADPIWRWRRAFWLAFERRGLIDDAWPVFGREAREYLNEHPDKKKRVLANGELQGAQRDQSVMLMRIGPFVVAEWSHSGSLRIWNAGDDVRAPELGRGTYYADEVRADCLHDQRHDGTQHYAWQLALSDWFAQRIGVRISLGEVIPNE